jgi:uncharacterized protein
MNASDMSIYPWGHERRFNDFPTHFKKIFSQRVQKISLDGGFTCPNRDGTRGTGGCTYCNNQTFNPSYCGPGITISRQLQRGIHFFSAKYPEMRYLAYFQAYSNTYATLDSLKILYQEALGYPGVIGLVIATRPDCISNELLDYLAKLSEHKYVMLELGLETHLDRTLKLINRGHSFGESVKALEEIAAYNIRTCAHMILGLPGESYSDLMNQAKIISQLPVENLKLHQLQIHMDTVMAAQYLENPDRFRLYTADEYVDLVIDYLEVLSPRVVVERFISQAPPELLIAPKWGLKNFEFVARVDKRLLERNTWQGRLFNYQANHSGW